MGQLFIKSFLKSGKKSKAERLWISLLKNLKKEKKERNPYHSIFKALIKTSPLTDLRSLRIGRTTYQIPVPLRFKKRLGLGCKWLIEEAVKEKNLKLDESLVLKIKEAEAGHGGAIAKKEVWHKTARSKIRYLRFRWF